MDRQVSVVDDSFERLAKLPRKSEAYIKLRNEIVERYMPYVNKVVWSKSTSYEIKKDLVGVGVIGLVRAVEEFNPSIGVNFAGFAMVGIKREIQHYVRDSAGLIRQSSTLFELRHQALPVIEDRVQFSHRLPTAQEMQMALGCTEEMAELVLREPLVTLSFEEGTGEYDTELSLEEVLGEIDASYGEFDQIDWFKSVLPIIEQLPEPCKKIFILYLQGFNKTVISRKMGCSINTIVYYLNKATAMVIVGLEPEDCMCIGAKREVIRMVAQITSLKGFNSRRSRFDA